MPLVDHPRRQIDKQWTGSENRDLKASKPVVSWSDSTSRGRVSGSGGWRVWATYEKAYSCRSSIFVARPEGLEPPAYWFEAKKARIISNLHRAHRSGTKCYDAVQSTRSDGSRITI